MTAGSVTSVVGSFSIRPSTPAQSVN
jgi:hypothetical protein